MREAYLLTFHWGWLSSGCYSQLRYEQGSGYLAYLKTLPQEFFGRLAFSHAGWVFDLKMAPEVRRVPGQELEPTLHVHPFNAGEVAEWREAVSIGQLEPVTYYYVPLVAEQVTGETLIRAIRFSRDVLQRELGASPAALTSHDPFTLMNWGTAQQVQLAVLTGHQVLLGGLEGMIVAMDGTHVPCIGATLQRHGLEAMSAPMIRALERSDGAGFCFATEMHWHHRTHPFERALRQVAVRFGEVQFEPSRITKWMEHVGEWPEIPAAGLGSKGWNGGGPDQMQMSSVIRQCELILPGIEALQALQIGGGDQTGKIEALWKRTLFLNDNHIRWLVHDHKRIYLPAARTLLSDVQAAARDLLQEISTPLQTAASRLVVWNLLGWERSGMAEAEVELPAGFKSITLRSPGDERPPKQVTPLEWGSDGDLRRARVIWNAQNLPAWGHRAYDMVFSTSAPAETEISPPSSLTLENARLRAAFATNGELVSLEDKRSGRIVRGGNRLLNLIARPVQEELKIIAGRALADQGGDHAGCFSASAEIVLPEVSSYDLDLDEMSGCLVLVEVDVIGRDGSSLAPTRRFPVINLHWMEAPQRYTGARSIPLGELASGTRLRITLWFLSEGQSVVGAGAVRSQRQRMPIEQWLVRWIYHFTPVSGEAVSAEVLEQDPVRQRLRFRGKLPQCNYEMIATLTGGKGVPRIDFETRFFFAEPTRLGIPTPAMPPEIGSYLGSNNERPYIPGLVVTFPVNPDPELVVDAPFALRDPMRSVHPLISQRSWLAEATEPVRNFWWGLSPFTALRCVHVRGWGGLIADGSPHFFIWRGLLEPGDTSLGISFGSSLIHPRTVSKRISRQSEWFEFGRGPGYADFQDGTDNYEFNHPQGRYVFRYSLSLETDPLALVREAQETAVPPWVVQLAPGTAVLKPSPLVQSGLQLDNPNVLLTGCDWLRSDSGMDVIRVRLCEMAGRDARGTMESRREVKKFEPGGLPLDLSLLDSHRLGFKIPAYGVREVILFLGE
jgi:hypothetical protein